MGTNNIKAHIFKIAPVMLLIVLFCAGTASAQNIRSTCSNILNSENVSFDKLIITKDTVEIWENMSIFQPDAVEMILSAGYLESSNRIFKKLGNIQKVRAIGYYPREARDKYGNLTSQQDEPVMKLGITRKTIKKVNWKYYKSITNSPSVSLSAKAVTNFIDGLVDEKWKNPKYY